jgi:hypothetical protein
MPEKGERGRPRTTIPEKNELIELGKDLVAWASEKDSETGEVRCRYAQWYCLKHGLLSVHWELMLQKPEFRGYYEQAQVLLARRFMDGTIEKSIAHRFLRVYCPDVKADENEKLAYESSLRRSESKENISEAVVVSAAALMDQISSYKDASASKDKKSCCTSSKEDHKS